MYEFGLTPQIFWSLTPAQFNAISRQFDDSRACSDFGFGTIAATIVNCHRDEKKHPMPFDWTDFYPRWNHLKAEKPKMSTEQMIFFFEMLKVRQAAREET